MVKTKCVIARGMSIIAREILSTDTYSTVLGEARVIIDDACFTGCLSKPEAV